MSVVTHGVVSIEDGTKSPVEYQPPRKVRVELHFDVAEGQDAETALAQVSELANARVKALLGQESAARPTTKTADTATGTTGSTSAATSAPAPAEKPARQAGPRAAGKPKPVEVKLPPETKADPTEVSLDATDEVAVDEFAATPATDAKPITDAELHSAAQKKNGEIKNPLAIRALVGEFRPAGTTGAFQLAEIPPARRQEFLDKLSKLT